MTLTDLIVYGTLLAAVVVLLRAIVRGSFSGGAGGMAGLTAFHGFQPKDKQRAVEMIVEQKSGKRLDEQSNDEPPSPEPPLKEERQKRK